MRKSYVVWIIVSLLICILVGGVVWADWGDAEQNFTRSFPEYGFSITAPCELKDVSDGGNMLVHLKGIADENTIEMTGYKFGVFRQPGGYRLSDLTSFFTTGLDDVEEVRIGHERFPGYVGYSYNRHSGLSEKSLFFIINQDVVALRVEAYDGLEMKFTEFLNGFSREQNEPESELELERIEKVIRTSVYEPIRSGNEWLCGKELVSKKTIVHYDRYENEIIEEKFNERGNVYRIIKSYYYSPKRKLLEKMTGEYPLKNLEESAYWKRDDDGRLIEIQGEVQEYEKPRFFEYDMQGRLIKIKEGNYVTYVNYTPGNQLMSAQLEIYDMDNDYVYKGKKGLIRSILCFGDKKTGRKEREVTETYKNGRLDFRWDIKYTFNADGKLISELMVGSNSHRDESHSHRYDRIYDEHGYLIKIVYIMDGEVREEVVYEHNEHGDWVKCIRFRISETSRFRKEKKADEITLREITYHTSLYRRMFIKVSTAMDQLITSFKRWFVGEEDPFSKITF